MVCCWHVTGRWRLPISPITKVLIMRRKIFDYLAVAADLAKRNDGRTYFLGAVGVRRDGTLVKALNGNPNEPMAQAHAEHRLFRKLDYGAPEVYVARVLKNGDFACAKPCVKCRRALRSKGVRNVYYTIANDEFGYIDLYSSDAMDIFNHSNHNANRY